MWFDVVGFFSLLQVFIHDDRVAYFVAEREAHGDFPEEGLSVKIVLHQRLGEVIDRFGVDLLFYSTIT